MVFIFWMSSVTGNWMTFFLTNIIHNKHSTLTVKEKGYFLSIIDQLFKHEECLNIIFSYTLGLRQVRILLEKNLWIKTKIIRWTPRAFLEIHSLLRIAFLNNKLFPNETIHINHSCNIISCLITRRLHTAISDSCVVRVYKL